MRTPPQRTISKFAQTETIARLRANAEASAAQARHHATREYLEGMATELSYLASQSGDTFLAYLFGLAAQEAHSLKDCDRSKAA